MGRLVRKNRHMGPMHAVLTRYGIGIEDKFGRGIWILESDLPQIEAAMRKDPTFCVVGGNYGWPKELCVNGTNIHNQVLFRDFKKLFTEVAGSERL